MDKKRIVIVVSCNSNVQIKPGKSQEAFPLKTYFYIV